MFTSLKNHDQKYIKMASKLKLIKSNSLKNLIIIITLFVNVSALTLKNYSTECEALFKTAYKDENNCSFDLNIFSISKNGQKEWFSYG